MASILPYISLDTCLSVNIVQLLKEAVEEALAAVLYVNEAAVVQTVEGLVQHPAHLLLF